MSLSGKKILLVDDEQDILSVLKSALDHWQASVDAFLKPKDALDAFTKQPDDFAIVLTDIRMSVMTGFELADKIHSIRANEPVLYISAFDIDKEMAGARSLEDVVTKPLDLSNFCGKVKNKLAIN